MNRTATATDSTEVLLLQQVAHEMCEELANSFVVKSYFETPEAEQRAALRTEARKLLVKHDLAVDLGHTDELLRAIEDEFFGWGGLEAEIAVDPRITDILINGADQVYVDRGRALEPLKFRFHSQKQLLQLVQRGAKRLGLQLDEQHPMLDGILPDGSRINIIIPPLAPRGPDVAIRRFPKLLTVNDLLANETLTSQALAFLRACVEARLNILISGGCGTGKTTLMSGLSGLIPEGQRIVTIEDAAELRLQQRHVVPLEVHNGFTTRDLLRNALRMRPDRIIIGECRGPEAFDMLQAMNTGHEGSLTTVHANGPRDAITRLESMIELTGFGIPPITIRREIASAIQIIVHLARVAGGRRRITRITEVVGMEQEVVIMDDLFKYEPQGVGVDGHMRGRLRMIRAFPTIQQRFVDAGVHLPKELFQE